VAKYAFKHRREPDPLEQLTRSLCMVIGGMGLVLVILVAILVAAEAF